MLARKIADVPPAKQPPGQAKKKRVARPHWSGYVSKKALKTSLEKLQREHDQHTADIQSLTERMATLASQEDVDALTQAVQEQHGQLQQVATDLQSSHDSLQNEMNALQSQIDAAAAGGGTVDVSQIDLSGLQAAVAANADAIAPLSPAVQALGALNPASDDPQVNPLS